jgi:ABC-type phosphate transport system substrate-binding protein
MAVGILASSGLLAAAAGPMASASSARPVLGPPTAGILGSGSTWSYIAVQKWIANIQANKGILVTYNPSGSAAGRTDYAQNTTDFGVSDIGYQGFDPVTGTNDVSNRPYAYLPITGGGTSFPYNIRVAGKKVINLRLSPLTLAKIFTNHITNWDDSAITADNNGRKLPSLPITVVVPSEGSGTTAMFTAYLANRFPSLWQPFNGGVNKLTEYWPRQGSQVAQNGSTQIMNYVQQPAANGAIGITEYAYPLQVGFPVVALENPAGYFVLPSEFNDAVALTQAVINYDVHSKNYLLETLNKVYTYTDPRSYPLASYSYTVMPVAKNDPRMAVSGGAYPAKWQSLADFLFYSICQGQTYIGKIGYSALPLNLVKAGFKQIDRIKAAAPRVQIASNNVFTCNNPTFVAGHPNANHLAQIAPQPPACAKAGHGPCSGTLCANCNGGRGSNNGPSPSPTPSSGSSASPGPSGSSAPPTSSGVTGPTNTGPVANNGPPPSAVPVTLSSTQSNGPSHEVLAILAALLFLLALVVPPLLSQLWSARSAGAPTAGSSGPSGPPPGGQT